MMRLRILVITFFCLLVAIYGSAQTIAELEQEKTEAVEAGNFKLAAELKQKISALKQKEEAEKIHKAEEAAKSASSGLQLSKEIELLEIEKKAAVDNQDFLLANELLKKITALKENLAAANSNQQVTKSSANSNEDAIAFLEKEKAEALEDANYKLAGEINTKIKELKANASKPQAPSLDISAKLKELEKKKADAVAAADYKLAGELNNQIKELKTNPSKFEANNSAIQAKIKSLEDEKAKAVAAADYKLAGQINVQIQELKANPAKFEASVNANNAVQNQIKALEQEKAKAVAAADYKLAGEINNKINNLKNQPATSTVASNQFQSTGSNAVIGNSGVRISQSAENQMTDIKYRRSSLYSIIRSSPGNEYANVIETAFINAPFPEKFNNHNLEARVIPPTSQLTNQVAKNIVAAWFNRDSEGKFNMDLIAQRGLYNASNQDINIAQGSSRGYAMLADAGEELIGNTFVIINEFKYTSKEEVAKKTSSGLKVLGFAASFIPGAGGTIASTVSNVAAVGVTVAGKGYWVKNTSHLYQLVWNEQVANEFYTKYWIDENNYDINKKIAFDNCTNLFTLRYIGFESAGADLQSSIFTDKTEEYLIAKATTKAVDAGIAKLERKFEQFRTKTPLHSVDPLTAKIGLKEGLQAGDKFEVLEQVQTETGKVQYVRKGIIYVDGKNIWDNTYSAEELVEMGKQPDQQNQFTVFRGGSTGFAPGMLIRQIN